MKKFLIILMLSIINTVIFASYAESCEITGILIKDASIMNYYIKEKDCGEIIESYIILEMDVIEAKKAGRADSGCKNETGIRTYSFKQKDINFVYNDSEKNLKKGQKVKFKKIYKDNRNNGPNISFYNFEVIQ